MKYVWLALVVCWFLFMTYLSHQNGAETAETSMKLAEMIGKTGLLGDEELNGKLRRVAHVVVFLVLSVLVSLMLRSWCVDWRFVLLVFVWCFADEVSKIFVDGRHFAWFDVGLNVVSCVIGVVVGMLI